MKNLNKVFVIMMMATVLFACGSKDHHDNANQAAEERADDSKKAADEANDDKFQTNKAEEDADFISNAVASNIAEIEIAQIGVQRSNSAEVKEIGRMLETDHNKLLKDLQSFAAKKSISVPTAGDDSDRKKIEDLNKEELKDFNKDWCEALVDKHEKSIEKFETRLQKTEDPDLKTFINSALPHLRSHLEKVKACHDKIAQAGK
jgi:putative membrane protein